MIDLKQAQLSEQEIFNYLLENDSIFIPPLSARKDLHEYSGKLGKYATHFCAYENNRLVGFIASYFNDFSTRTGYISSVSVIEEYQGKGITSSLLSQVINYGKLNNFDKLRLEVSKLNINALNIYQYMGFKETDRTPASIFMALMLKAREV